MLWDECREWFAWDGAWVDLVAYGTGPADWDAILDALRAESYPLRCWRDGVEVPVPGSSAWAFAERHEATILLAIEAGPVTAHCHFFDDDIEFDIDPREVNDPDRFASVLGFMRLVARAIRRPVLATPENVGPDWAFLVVQPDGSAAARNSRTPANDPADKGPPEDAPW